MFHVVLWKNRMLCRFFCFCCSVEHWSVFQTLMHLPKLFYGVCVYSYMNMYSIHIHTYEYVYTHTKVNRILCFYLWLKKKNKNKTTLFFFKVTDNSCEEENLDFELSFAVYPASRYRSNLWLKISYHGLEYWQTELLVFIFRKI